MIDGARFVLDSLRLYNLSLNNSLLWSVHFKRSYLPPSDIEPCTASECVEFLLKKLFL